MNLSKRIPDVQSSKLLDTLNINFPFTLVMIFVSICTRNINVYLVQVITM